ncbi:hypothetical protein SAMN04488505_105150 [Chitinophaga rupis]|uniref:Uncharacterized protein n=1 Tax=Chitinophaga rupis TaxID=573321 RepID=A0A1H7ZNP9_9BACT|nr:hypothetical protein SAMN04488505_105150 [Chitinophaga rupis]
MKNIQGLKAMNCCLPVGNYDQPDVYSYIIGQWAIPYF